MVSGDCLEIGVIGLDISLRWSQFLVLAATLAFTKRTVNTLTPSLKPKPTDPRTSIYIYIYIYFFLNLNPLPRNLNLTSTALVP